MVSCAEVIRVLLIEDEESDAVLFQKYLKRSKNGDCFSVTVAVSTTEGLGFLERETFDIVVADLALPDSSELQTVDIIREQFPFVALIVVSGRAEEMAIGALQRGAQDCLVKGMFNADTLATSIRYAIERHRRLAETKAEKSAVDLSVSMDTVTGLPNRRLFEERLQMACQLVKRENRKCALLFLELDDIKETRDVFGQKVVHLLARLAADIFRAHSRENDTVARVGDGRFMFILIGFEDDYDAGHFAQKILSALKIPLIVNDRKFHLNARLGISVFGFDGETADELVAASERALLSAQANGDRIHFHSAHLNVQSLTWKQKESLLRQAFQEDQLKICFERRIDISTGQWVGVQVGLCFGEESSWSTENILKLADSAGIYESLFDWILHEVCKHMLLWIKDSPYFSFFLSLPSTQIAQVATVDKISETLKAYGLPPQCCAIEISGRLIIEEKGGRQEAFFKALRRTGIGLVLPYSCFGVERVLLPRISRLPLRGIKIDVSLIDEIARQKTSFHVMKSFIDLIHTLGLESMGAGVASAEQLETLKAVGCRLAQGPLASQTTEVFACSRPGFAEQRNALSKVCWV